MQNPLPDAQTIANAQLRWTEAWHVEEESIPADGFMQLVGSNHQRNYGLWHEEDVARRDDLGAERVQQAKRAIDKFNQQRNDFIEQMDKALVAALQPRDNVPMNSETPGMIIDRLSILALKEYHMLEQAVRTDVEDAHRQACAHKLGVIRKQRSDLTGSLQTLLDEVAVGKRSFRVYYQFKMYNDPTLNPQLYAKKDN